MNFDANAALAAFYKGLTSRKEERKNSEEVVNDSSIFQYYDSSYVDEKYNKDSGNNWLSIPKDYA